MTKPTPLEQLLKDSGLADKAVQVEANLVRMQWGSAFVMVGVSGTAIVAVAPLFRHVPKGKETAFYRQLLQHNAYMGGIASFAIQPDGWVVLHAGRALKGLDAQEFAALVSGVGRFADQFDDQLAAEYFGGQLENSAIPVEPASAGHSGNIPATD
jgi:hypothetical protein